MQKPKNKKPSTKQTQNTHQIKTTQQNKNTQQNKTTQQNKSNQESQPIEQKELSIKEQITNLTSLYNALQYINEQLDNSFKIQRENAEKVLLAKTKLTIKLKESNFNLFAKLNSMQNISTLDDYLLINYDKFLTIAPKINNILENINDFTSNINYSIDRLYLSGNIICDSSKLSTSIQNTTKSIDEMNAHLNLKKDKIYEMKLNYTQLLNSINLYKETMSTVKTMLAKYKSDFLCNNIDRIINDLTIENKSLLNSIIND